LKNISIACLLFLFVCQTVDQESRETDVELVCLCGVCASASFTLRIRFAANNISVPGLHTAIAEEECHDACLHKLQSVISQLQGVWSGYVHLLFCTKSLIPSSKFLLQATNRIVQDTISGCKEGFVSTFLDKSG
jgi:hypothetical protein